MEAGLKSFLLNFADDTIVGGRALIAAECEVIQKDLDQIIQWSEKWQMTFNFDKCKVMLFVSRNSNNTRIFSLHGNPMQVVKEESETISSDLTTQITVRKRITKQRVCGGEVASVIDCHSPRRDKAGLNPHATT